MNNVISITHLPPDRVTTMINSLEYIDRVILLEKKCARAQLVASLTEYQVLTGMWSNNNMNTEKLWKMEYAMMF